jgi:hypothetical protein
MLDLVSGVPEFRLRVEAARQSFSALVDRRGIYCRDVGLSRTSAHPIHEDADHDEEQQRQPTDENTFRQTPGAGRVAVGPVRALSHAASLV